MSLKNMEIDMIGQLAKLKDIDYRNTLAIATLLELLVDKGIITTQEFAAKAHDLELANFADITLTMLHNRKARLKK